MKNEMNAMEITLEDLLGIFIKRFFLMVLAAVVVMVGAFGVSKLTKPRYESTATLYILRQNNEESSNTASDFSLALNVVNDCTYFLKSHAVLDEVIKELALSMSYDDLADSISTSNPDSTRILEVTVEAASPDEAKRIVDSLCEIGSEKIVAAMGFKQVNLYEYGTYEEEPSNKVGLMTYLLVGIVAAILVYSAFLLQFLLDDSIRTDEDVERYLGLSILGEIPDADSTKKGAYGYGYGRNSREEV